MLTMNSCGSRSVLSQQARRHRHQPTTRFGNLTRRKLVTTTTTTTRAITPLALSTRTLIATSSSTPTPLPRTPSSGSLAPRSPRSSTPRATTCTLSERTFTGRRRRTACPSPTKSSRPSATSYPVMGWRCRSTRCWRSLILTAAATLKSSTSWSRTLTVSPSGKAAAVPSQCHVRSLIVWTTTSPCCGIQKTLPVSLPLSYRPLRSSRGAGSWIFYRATSRAALQASTPRSLLRATQTCWSSRVTGSSRRESGGRVRWTCQCRRTLRKMRKWYRRSCTPLCVRCLGTVRVPSATKCGRNSRRLSKH
eukprot:PhM_4_TR9539/c0_g1_i1/m.103167